MVLGALEVAEVAAHEPQVVEIGGFSAAIAAQRADLQRATVELGGQRVLALVLVDARDVAKRGTSGAVVAGGFGELEGADVVAKGPVEAAHRVVAGAQVAECGGLARQVADSSVLAQAPLVEPREFLGLQDSLDPLLGARRPSAELEKVREGLPHFIGSLPDHVQELRLLAGFEEYDDLWFSAGPLERKCAQGCQRETMRESYRHRSVLRALRL